MKKLKNFYLSEELCELIDECKKKTGVARSRVAEDGIRKEINVIKERFPEWK